MAEDGKGTEEAMEAVDGTTDVDNYFDSGKCIKSDEAMEEDNINILKSKGDLTPNETGHVNLITTDAGGDDVVNGADGAIKDVSTREDDIDNDGPDVAIIEDDPVKESDVIEIDDDAVPLTEKQGEGGMNNCDLGFDFTGQVAIALESVNEDDIPSEPQPKIDIFPNTYDFEDDCQKYRYSRVLILSPFLVDDWSNEVISKHLATCDSYYINALRKNGQTDIAGKLEVTFAKRGAAETAKKEISGEMGESYVKYVSLDQNKVTLTLSRKRRIVVVTGIPPKLMTVDKLMALFPNCLTVIPGSVIITKDCGYAYIEYEDYKTAFNMRKILKKDPIYIGKWLLKFSLLERPPENEPRRSKTRIKLEPKPKPVDEELKNASKERQKAINAIRVANQKLSFLKDLEKKRSLSTTQIKSKQNFQAELKAAVEKKSEVERKWPGVLEYEKKSLAKEIKVKEKGSKDSFSYRTSSRGRDGSSSTRRDGSSSRHHDSSARHKSDHSSKSSSSTDKKSHLRDRKESFSSSKQPSNSNKQSDVKTMPVQEVRRRQKDFTFNRPSTMDIDHDRRHDRIRDRSPHRRPAANFYGKMETTSYNHLSSGMNRNNTNQEMFGMPTNPFMNNSFEPNNRMAVPYNNSLPNNMYDNSLSSRIDQFADSSSSFNTTRNNSMTNNMPLNTPNYSSMDKNNTYFNRPPSYDSQNEYFQANRNDGF